MAATLETALAFQGRRGAAQLEQGLGQGEALHLVGLQQGGEPVEQLALLNQQLVRQQAGQVQLEQVMAWVKAPVDRF